MDGETPFSPSPRYITSLSLDILLPSHEIYYFPPPRYITSMGHTMWYRGDWSAILSLPPFTSYSSQIRLGRLMISFLKKSLSHSTCCVEVLKSDRKLVISVKTLKNGYFIHKSETRATLALLKEAQVNVQI